jgi:hypothetical protein
MTRGFSKISVYVFTATLIVLGARAIAYSATASPEARLLEQRAGGPALPMLLVGALSLGVALAVAICWLAALGVRERALLDRCEAPRFRIGRTVALALGLAVATSLSGGLFEAYLHWRAGLGWHGLHCMFGPVHRDLLPVECALSLVGAALIAAAEHVFAWMRRTFASLRTLPPRATAPGPAWLPVGFELPRTALRLTAGSPRAPPVLS